MNNKQECKALVWNYYKQTDHIKKEIASYNTYLKTLNTKWSSTSGLICHLASEHLTKYTEYLKLKKKAKQVFNKGQSKNQVKIFETQV